MKKKRGYWDLENCKKDAEKHHTRNDWCLNSTSAYSMAAKKGWLDECCKHMIKMKCDPQNWSLETCKEKALKYNSKCEWGKKDDPSYRAAIRNGWLDECCKHMKIKLIKPKKHWILENCKKDAEKYETRSEWKDNSQGAYGSAQKNKWLDECCKHMKIVGNLKKRLIYAIEFDNKSVYIGLTHDVKERINRHLNDKRSIVQKVSKKFKFVCKVLSDYIDVESAQKLEGNFINIYRSNKWNILNKIKTGGIGGNIIKWTEQECLSESLKYNSKSEWENNNPSSYNSARKNGWLNKCSKHMMELRKENNYWTLERCMEESKKYKSKVEWRKKDGKSYSSAKSKNWIPKCCEHMVEIRKPNGYWTKQKCIEVAKKYNTQTEWNEKSSYSFTYARKNGFIDECTEHMVKTKKPNGFWTLEKCLEDAKKYNSRKEWELLSSGGYRAAKRHKWRKECSKIFQK